MCLSLLSPRKRRQFQKTPPRQKIDGKFWITASVWESHMLTFYFKTSSTNYSHWFNSNIDVFWKFQFNTNVFCPFSLWNISDFSQIWLLYTHTFILFYLIFGIMVSIYEYWTRMSPTLTRLDLMLTRSVFNFADTVCLGKYLNLRNFNALLWGIFW